ncbi:hypothetical protein ACFX1S_008245 [Malus domestica]
MSTQNSGEVATTDSWVVDTGASHHMTPDVTVLNRATPYEGTEKIIVGNGESLEVTHIGNGILQTQSHALHLKQILHVPLLTVNLLSVKKLCKDNHSWFICDDAQFFVQDKATGAILHHGKSSKNELFKILVHIFRTLLNQGVRPSAFLGHTVKSSLWHQRLRHPSNEILVAMLRDSAISCPSDEVVTVCSHCLNGKMSRLPFSDRIDRVDIPFCKIHSDVWGP